MLAFVYLFLVSIGLMSVALKGFGKGFAENLISTTANPFVALFVGILATSIITQPIDKPRFSQLFNRMKEDMLALFAATKEAFIKSDEEKASLSWKYERKIVKKCDEIVEELAKSSLSVNEAVCFTLIARYFKRLAAHLLANIATSVILPLSDLDYFDEKKRRGKM